MWRINNGNYKRDKYRILQRHVNTINRAAIIFGRYSYINQQGLIYIATYVCLIMVETHVNKLQAQNILIMHCQDAFALPHSVERPWDEACLRYLSIYLINYISFMNWSKSHISSAQPTASEIASQVQYRKWRQWYLRAEFLYQKLPIYIQRR